MAQWRWSSCTTTGIFAGAEQEFSALELNPSDADVRHEHAHYLMAMGRLAESEAESRRAVELDPVGDGLNSCLCWHSFAARDYDEAVRLAAKFLKSQPDDPWERTILGWTYEQKRMPEQAVAEFKGSRDYERRPFLWRPFLCRCVGAPHMPSLAIGAVKRKRSFRHSPDRAKKVLCLAV